MSVKCSRPRHWRCAKRRSTTSTIGRLSLCPASIRPIPTHQDYPEVSTWLTQQVAPTFKMWIDGLQALGAPPSAQEDWNATLAAVEKINKLNTDQITAANKRDTAASRRRQRTQPTQDDLVAASEKAGVSDCADVHAA